MSERCRACGALRPPEELLLVTGIGERFFVCRPSIDPPPGQYVTCFRSAVHNVTRHRVAPASPLAQAVK